MRRFDIKVKKRKVFSPHTHIYHDRSSRSRNPLPGMLVRLLLLFTRFLRVYFIPLQTVALMVITFPHGNWCVVIKR